MFLDLQRGDGLNLCFSVSISSSEKRFLLKGAGVSCFFLYRRCSKAVRIIWGGGALSSRRKIPVKILYSLWLWSSKYKCKCIFMYICQLYFACSFCCLFCWDQSRCAVCYSFSWQCCNRKNYYILKNVQYVCSINKKTTKKVIVLCSTWTLNVSFTSGSTEKKVKDTVLSLLFVSVEYEYCILLLESRIRRSKKRKGKKKQ